MTPSEIWPFKPAWTDITPFVVHFTRSAENLSSILQDRQIKPSGPFGWGYDVPEIRDSQLSSCFTEVPLTEYERVMRGHGQYGIVFEKSYLTKQGGAPVWYVDTSGETAGYLTDCVKRLRAASNWTHPFWKLTPFIQQLRPNLRFEWEREWRVPGGLSWISKKNVTGLITPRASVGQFDAFGLEIHTVEDLRHQAFRP